MQHGDASVLPCELFHRIPYGEHGDSPWLSQLHRETLGRLTPMKFCGRIDDDTCHLGKHHNTAVYLSTTGVFKLIF